jgi:hypothetical protein
MSYFFVLACCRWNLLLGNDPVVHGPGPGQPPELARANGCGATGIPGMLLRSSGTALSPAGQLPRQNARIIDHHPFRLPDPRRWLQTSIDTLHTVCIIEE